MPKRKIKLARKVLSALDLPEDATGVVPRITLLGQENMLVENHEGIFEYGSKSVRLYLREGLLHISGLDLELRELTADRLYVSGVIESVSYEGSKLKTTHKRR